MEVQSSKLKAQSEKSWFTGQKTHLADYGTIHHSHFTIHYSPKYQFTDET